MTTNGVDYIKGITEGLQIQLEDIKDEIKGLRNEVISLKMWKWQVTGMATVAVAIVEVIARNWPK